MTEAKAFEGYMVFEVGADRPKDWCVYRSESGADHRASFLNKCFKNKYLPRRVRVTLIEEGDHD